MANDDLISRQAAIDAICEHGTDLERRGITVIAVVYHKQATVDLLENLPSAERRGRWIENEFGAYCSECGLYAYRSNGIPWKSNYCPMCGARLEATK